MGFLGTDASLYADMTLIAQTAGFILLFSGSIYTRRKKFLKQHDTASKIAVLVGYLSLMWMGFSLVSNFLPLISITLTGLLIVSHAIIGLFALFMGLFLVLDEIKKTKISMQVTFFSWTAAIFLGIVLYIVYIA